MTKFIETTGGDFIDPDTIISLSPSGEGEFTCRTSSGKIHYIPEATARLIITGKAIPAPVVEK